MGPLLQAFWLTFCNLFYVNSTCSAFQLPLEVDSPISNGLTVMHSGIGATVSKHGSIWSLQKLLHTERSQHSLTFKTYPKAYVWIKIGAIDEQSSGG